MDSCLTSFESRASLLRAQLDPIPRAVLLKLGENQVAYDAAPSCHEEGRMGVETFEVRGVADAADAMAGQGVGLVRGKVGDESLDHPGISRLIPGQPIS